MLAHVAEKEDYDAQRDAIDFCQNSINDRLSATLV